MFPRSLVPTAKQQLLPSNFMDLPAFCSCWKNIFTSINTCNHLFFRRYLLRNVCTYTCTYTDICYLSSQVSVSPEAPTVLKQPPTQLSEETLVPLPESACAQCFLVSLLLSSFCKLHRFSLIPPIVCSPPLLVSICTLMHFYNILQVSSLSTLFFSH